MTAHARDSQRISPSMINVSPLVLPATADDALILEKLVSLKPVVGTVVQGGVILTLPENSEALIAFARSRGS